MARRWVDIAADARFGLLEPDEQDAVRENWLYSFAQRPKFTALSSPDQETVYKTMEERVSLDDSASRRMAYIDRVYAGESDVRKMIADKYFWELPETAQRIALARRDLPYREAGSKTQRGYLEDMRRNYDERQSRVAGPPEDDRPPPEIEEERGVLGESASALAAGTVSLGGTVLEWARAVGEHAPGPATPPRPLGAPTSPNLPSNLVRQARREEQGRGAEPEYDEPEFYYKVASETPSLRRKGKQRLKRPLGESLSDPLWWARNLGENIPQIGVSIAAGGVGGVKVGFFAMMALEGGSHYRTAIEDGASEEVAFQEATAVGLINGALEMVGVSGVVKAFKKGGAFKSLGRFLLGLGKSSLAEGVTEAGQTQISEHIRKFGHKPDLKEAEILDETIKAGIIGSALGGGGHVVGSVTNRLAEAKSASRKDVAEARGVPKSELPPELDTQPKREKAVAEAKAAVAADKAQAQQAPGEAGGSEKARVRTAMIDAIPEGVALDAVDATLSLHDAVADTLIRDGKIANADEYYRQWQDVQPGVSKSPEALQQVQAYHGGPTALDTFSTKYVGTGEGNVTFGWGLYFTDKKEIAKHYAETLGGGLSNAHYAVVEAHIPGADKSLVREAVSALYHTSSPNGAAAEFYNANARIRNIGKPALRQMMVALANVKSRNLYKTTLHKGKKEGEYAWLDWDRPISEKDLRVVRHRGDQEGWTDETHEMFEEEALSGAPQLASSAGDGTGKGVYRAIEAIYGSDREASEFLLRAGIDGIRYPAGALSTGAKTAAKNYVVFDENAVTIDEHIQYQGGKDAPKGSMQMLSDGKAIMGLANVADESTLAHESAHIFRRILSGHYADEAAALENWAGVKDGKWTRETDERVAEAFERYMHRGVAPNKKLQGTFAKFKNWLKAIYGKLRPRLDAPAQRAFDKLLGTDADIAAAEAPAETAPAESPSAEDVAPQDAAEDVKADAGRNLGDAFMADTRAETAVSAPTAQDPSATSRNASDIVGNFGDSILRHVEKARRLRTQYPDVYESFRQALAVPEAIQDRTLDFMTETFGDLTSEQASLLHEHREDPAGYPLPEGDIRMDEAAKQLDSIYDAVEHELLNRKLVGKWPESAIGRNYEEIATLQDEIAGLKDGAKIAKRQALIDGLEESNRVLANLRYARRLVSVDSYLERMSRSGTLNDKLRSNAKRLQGRTFDTLAELKEAFGDAVESDARVSLADLLAYAQTKTSLYDFHEDLKANQPNLVLPKADAPANWIPVQGNEQYKGYMAHPFFVEAIHDFTDPGRGKTWVGTHHDRIASMFKQIKFYKFFVMLWNNMQQQFGAVDVGGLMRLPAAMKSVFTRDSTYRAAQAADLFSMPSDIPWKTYQQRTKSAFALLESASPPWWKGIKRVLDIDSAAELGKVLLPTDKNILLAANRHLTWSLDRVTRMATVKALVARGMPFNEAVVKARNFHADYNLLKTDAAKWASRVLLTPRYQYAMWANLFPQIAKGAILGKRASGAGMSRAEGVKSLARIGGMLGLSMAQAAMMGYALIEGYRFVKETGDDDEPEEDVALMVGPFSEPFKVVGRARQGYASGGIPKALLRVAFNKLAVFPHVAVSLVQGRNWRGEEIFTRGATAGEKVAQLGKFLLHELYPIFQEADDWTNDKQEAVNKLLQLVAVTRYRRGPMRNYYMRRLKRDFADMKFNARKKMQDDPTNADRYAREASARMEKHSNQVQAYINANYDKLEKMKSPSAIDRIIAQFVPSLIDKPTKEPKH